MVLRISNALQELPALQALQLYSEKDGSVSPNRFIDMLKVMPSLPNLSILRVAAHQKHHVAVLPADQLGRITELELGHNMSLNHPPTGLQVLRLQSLCRTPEASLGYAELFLQMHNLPSMSLFSLSIDEFDDGTLLTLPVNLQQLTLLQVATASCAV